MKRLSFYLIIAGIMITNKGLSQNVSAEIEINASHTKVWTIITSPEYAKILGNEFDKNAFVESDWKLGSDVHFKYEPDKTVSTGTISKLIPQEYIQIDYDFDGFKYVEIYELIVENKITTLKLFAGPYTSDYEAQIVVWNSWLKKVKELSEDLKNY